MSNSNTIIINKNNILIILNITVENGIIKFRLTYHICQKIQRKIVNNINPNKMILCQIINIMNIIYQIKDLITNIINIIINKK